MKDASRIDVEWLITTQYSLYNVKRREVGRENNFNYYKIYTYKHIHTHTYTTHQIYIYIYIYTTLFTLESLNKWMCVY